MPATTPNRGYPYPLPADPVDIPGDICALADAVNADLGVLEAMAVARPIAQIRSSQPQAVPKSVAVGGFLPDTPLVFDSVDVDTGGFSRITTQPSYLTLPVGPAYWMWAAVRFPEFTNAAGEPSVLFRITSVDVTEVFVDFECYPVDGTILSRVHTIGGLVIPTATDDTFQVGVLHNSDTATEVFSEAVFGVLEIRPVA